MRAVFVAMAVLLLSGCTDSGENGAQSEEDTRTSPTPPSVLEPPLAYRSGVDGVAVRWPLGWYRSEKALGGGRISNNVELLALTTFPGAVAQCAPAPDGAMAMMKADDVLIVLRTSDGPAHESLQQRPKTLLTALRPDPDATPRDTRGPGMSTCYPQGVEAHRSLFQEHGRHYEIFVAAHVPFGDARKAQVEEIWSALVLSPIALGRDAAEPGREYWHFLSTHCGIKATTFDGREWVVEGHSPGAWSGPEERGIMVLTNKSRADFRSRDGERHATFRPRTPQDPPLSQCS